MKRITIIGGGASGTLLAANLLRNFGSSDIEINLVEKSSEIGRGVAFGTEHATHLLNVPAGRMGAYPDEVDGFYRWLVEKGESYSSDDFVPRVKYGAYLRETFKAAAGSIAGARLNLCDDEAVDISVDDDSANVILRSGEILPSDRVVLAFGNFKPPHPTVPDLAFVDSPNYFQDPWGSDLYNRVGLNDSMFIIGTGLSMVDVAIHFHKNGHQGKIFAISTRGLLPATHKLGYTYPSFAHELESTDRITDILKTVRRHIAAANEDGSDWRAVIDSLRPVTQKLWLELPISEKKYFKQHLSRYWNVARHRMPPEAAAVVDTMKMDGKLEVLRGRLRSIEVGAVGRFQISYNAFGDIQSLNADHLINCIGSEANFSRIDSTLIRNLIIRKHIRPDELLLGIDSTPDGRVISKDGEPSNVVRTLGTALKGVLWESTAIPEIRTQARDLALKLMSE